MNKRIEWIDIARGVGIILVVLGHSVTSAIRRDSTIAMEIYKVAYSVQIPLLLFVSGISFNLNFNKYENQSFVDFCLKKTKRLMLPYLSYSFLVYLIFYIASFAAPISSLLEKMSFGRISILEWAKDLLIGNNIFCEHLWYLYSLFLLSLISFLLIKIMGKWYKYLLVIFMILMWLFLKEPTDYDVIWKTALKGIWFAVGCVFGAREISSLIKKCTVIIPGSIAFIFWHLYQDNIHIGGAEVALRFSVVLLFVISIIFFSQIIDGLGHKIIKWLGKNSMYIYIFHQPFWGSGMGVLLYSVFHLPVIICIILAFLACIIVPIIIYKVLQNPRLKKIKYIFIGE